MSRILAAYPIGVAATVLALSVALVFLPSTPRHGGGPIYLLVPGDTHGRSLPIAIVDQTGQLLGANAAIDPFTSTGVHAVPGYPRRLRLFWLGGLCDRSANLRLTNDGPRLHIAIDTFAQGTGCLLIGIGRTVDLIFDSVVDPAGVTVVAS